jgi:RNA polymerase sigma-70 factor (ECF subfamily)
MGDAELLARARRGDVAAFEELYLGHRDWVYSLALRRSGRREDALDVVQETFAYLLRKLGEVELRGKLTTFLYPVVVHNAAAARRRSGRFAGDEEALLAARARDEAAPAREDLAAAVARLPEGQREALLLRFADGLSLEEIAAALAIPLGTVKSRLHHALAALREDGRARRTFEDFA